MKKLEFKTAKELKLFLENNRKNVTNINGVECREIYPMFEVSNKHASYYFPNKQEYVCIYAPFIVEVK